MHIVSLPSQVACFPFAPVRLHLRQPGGSPVPPAEALERLARLNHAEPKSMGQIMSIRVLDPPSPTYTRPEAAKYLSVSLRTVDRLIATKQLQVCKVHRRRVVIPKQLLERFIKRNCHGGDEANDRKDKGSKDVPED
jgi:excisionase family DNA binding protein